MLPLRNWLISIRNLSPPRCYRLWERNVSTYAEIFTWQLTKDKTPMLSLRSSANISYRSETRSTNAMCLTLVPRKPLKASINSWQRFANSLLHVSSVRLRTKCSAILSSLAYETMDTANAFFENLLTFVEPTKWQLVCDTKWRNLVLFTSLAKRRNVVHARTHEEVHVPRARANIVVTLMQPETATLMAKRAQNATRITRPKSVVHL